MLCTGLVAFFLKPVTGGYQCHLAIFWSCYTFPEWLLWDTLHVPRGCDFVFNGKGCSACFFLLQKTQYILWDKQFSFSGNSCPELNSSKWAGILWKIRQVELDMYGWVQVSVHGWIQEWVFLRLLRVPHWQVSFYLCFVWYSLVIGMRNQIISLHYNSICINSRISLQFDNLTT